MPSLVDQGEPLLTSYDPPKSRPKNLDNELFQNHINNDAYLHKRADKFDSKETNGFLRVESNGNNHYSNGGHSPDYLNGNAVTPLDEENSFEKLDVLDDDAIDATICTPIKNCMVEAAINPKEELLKVDPANVDPSLAWKYDGNVYRNGPDQILPSTALTTTHADGAVRIRYGDSANARRVPISVPSLLKKNVDRAPDHPALAIKRNGEWQKWSFKDYYEDVRTVAKAFIALGLERYHAVCILGFNTPEWFEADLGAIFAGGFAAGIYTTNSAEACAFCAKDSRANIFVVEDEKQLAKVLSFRHELPHLKAIVQYSGEPTVEGVLSWSKLMLLGKEQPDSILEERLSQIAVNQCCTLIYTSGTTGNPKGVMLTHDNLTWTAHINAHWCGFRELSEDIISFLPLSHVAAQVADMYCPLTCCGTVTFGDKNALKGSLIDTMKEIQPTKFLAVPRVWEKMYERMQEIGRSTTGVKKAIATWAKNKGMEYSLKRMNGVKNPESFGFKVANKLVLSKIREALGLARCDLHLSGAAPLSPEIIKYFWSLNIIVTEVYGMSESTGPHCMAIEAAFRLGSCGKTLAGCETKIRDPDADGNGEILMNGRHVSMGYLGQPQKTSASIDDQGYLHSEDVGYVDKDGYLFITGRLKELLITAGGENVAPVPIEDKVKHELPVISQAMVLGDRLKFLSVLLTLKTEVDKDTLEPLDKLLPYTKQWIEANGDCQVETVHDVIAELYSKKNGKLIQAIQHGIDRANAKAVSQAQKLQKWRLLPLDFSIPGGELGPTLKLKRNIVSDKYKSTIEEMYS